MYCTHYYLLPRIGALWILCMVVDRVCVHVSVDLMCVRVRGISSTPFLPFSVYMISLCIRVALPEEDCLVDVL